MAPVEMAPADPPDPSPWSFPFHWPLGGSQTSKPIWESEVGRATPTMRQKGWATWVVPTVPPSGRNCALSMLVPVATVLPASAAQLAASPCPVAAAWLLAASTGKRATIQAEALSTFMRPSHPSGADRRGLSNGRMGRSSRRRRVHITLHQRAGYQPPAIHQHKEDQLEGERDDHRRQHHHAHAHQDGR